MAGTGPGTAPATPAGRRAGVIVPSAIVLAYSLIIGRLPLLNYLGYEYSVAVALLMPIIPGLIFLRVFDGSPGAWARATGLAFRCLAIPLLLGLLNAFLVKNCAVGEGVAWFALLPVIGMAWIVAMAYFCASAFRRPTAWFLLFLAAVMLHPFLLGYYTPRVDSYNFVYGYFPGVTYDEDLRITGELIAWRAVTLVCAAGFVAAGALAVSRRRSVAERGGRAGFSSPRGGSPIAAAVLVLSVAVMAAAWLYRTELGFETTTPSLRKALGSLASTRHFRIYYDSTAIPADEIRWVAAEHEFRFRQLTEFLETDTGRVIDSYIFPDAGTKRRLTGAGGTDIAKPWRGEIYLDGASWRYTLKHELAHALASEFGMRIVRANLNIGLVEGLAMASSPSFGNRTLQEYAASMIRFGIVDDPAALIRPAGFAFQSSTVSYVLMGAFCSHLIGRYGIAPFKSWYGGDSPGEAFGKDADSLIAEWLASLDAIRVPEEWRAHTEYYFRRGSIFARECARAVANLNADGEAALARKDLPGATGLYARALEESWNASSFAGLLRALMGSGEFDAVVRMFDAEQGDTLRRGSIAGLKLLYGDALLMKGDFAAARKVCEELRSLGLSPAMNEAVALRLAVTAHPALGEYVAPVVTGAMDDSAALDWLAGIPGEENPALVSFLRGRLQIEMRDYVSAVRETAEYFAPFDYPELNGALNDIAATAIFRLEDFSSARAFFERTLGYGPGKALEMRVRDRLDRCSWFEREWGGIGLTLSGAGE